MSDVLYRMSQMLTFGMPMKWKNELSNKFVTVDRENITLEWLITFGGQQESKEHYNRALKVIKEGKIPHKAESHYKKEYIWGSLTTSGHAQKFKGNEGAAKWCPYHKTSGHSMNECTVVQKLAESASQSRDTKNKSSPMKFVQNKQH